MKEVELEKKDWEQMRINTIALLKTALAQVIIYRKDLKNIDEEISKFPEEEDAP